MVSIFLISTQWNVSRIQKSDETCASTLSHIQSIASCNKLYTFELPYVILINNKLALVK